MSLIDRLKCLFGYHVDAPDISARYDRCIRCGRRIRVV